MPLFACRKCCCVENTALSAYWHASMEGHPVLCSECDPLTHEWHGQFPKRSAAGMLVDQQGFIWSPEEVKAGMARHTTLFGVVSPRDKHRYYEWCKPLGQKETVEMYLHVSKKKTGRLIVQHLKTRAPVSVGENCGGFVLTFPKGDSDAQPK